MQHLPKYWVPYAERKTAVLAAAKPLSDLRVLGPDNPAKLEAFLKQSGRAEAELRFVPVRGRHRDAAAIIDGTSGELVQLIAMVPW